MSGGIANVPPSSSSGNGSGSAAGSDVREEVTPEVLAGNGDNDGGDPWRQ